MVISVFPDVSQGFARYEQSRRNRLIDQQARTEQEAMRRRRAAFNQMLGQIKDPQQRLALEAGGVEGVPAFFEGQRRAQAAAAEQEAARREQIQQYGMGVATRRRQLAQQEGFNEDEFLRQAYDFGRSEYGMQMPYEQFVERARNPMAGEIPEAASEVNWSIQRAINPETGQEEFVRIHPRTGDTEWLNVQAPPRGSSAADAVLGILASQLAPASGDGADQANAARAVLRFGGSIGNIREQAEEVGPSGFGVAGGLRRGAQNISQQLLSASGMSIDNLRSEALGLAQSGQNPDPELAERVRSMFDPNLSSLGPAAILLAYQAAEAVAGQSGRALSDNDFRRFLDVIGDPGSLFSTYDGFMSRLDLLDRETLNAVNAERAVAGLPSIPRSMRFSDGSALEWLSAAPEDRAAVVDRYSDRGDTPDPSDEPRGDSGGDGTRRRRYVPGQGFVDG